MIFGFLAPWPYGWTVLIVVSAFTVRGVLGFGAGLISVALLVLVLPITQVVPLVLCLEFIGSLTLGTMDVKHIKWKDLYWLWPLTIAGLGVGLFILRATEAEQLTRILGGFLLAYVFYLLLYKPNVRTVVPRIWGILFGFVGGVMGSMYGTGGPSLVAYLQLRQLSTRSLRATIQFVALTDNVMRGAGYVMLGLLTFPVFISALWLAAPTFLGIWIGNRIHHRIPPQYFEWGIIIILGLTGIKLLFGTFI